MKTIQRKIILLVVLLAGFGITSCDFTGLTDAVDDFGIIIGLEPINTYATVQLVDASTGELIDSNIAVDFGGTNGGDVIDIYSDPLPEDEVGDGILNFGIVNNVTPSESNPANITLSLSANGYISSNKTVAITAEGSNSFTIKMVNENNKPQGVKSTSNTDGSADETGAVQTTYTANTMADGNSDFGAGVEISSGTVLKDSQGNALSGQITTDITYYDPTDPGAMESIPADLVDENGNGIVLAGGTSIQLSDANGRVASSASSANENGVTVNFSLPENLYNPEEGRNYAEGDSISIFIQEEASAKSLNKDFEWTWAVLTVPIAPVLQFDIDEYTKFTNRPFYLGSSVPVCVTTLALERNGQTGPIQVAGNTTGFSINETIPNGVNSKILLTPRNLTVNYTLTTPSGQTVDGSFATCGSVSETLPPPPANSINATIDVNLECANPNEKITVTSIPTASILYRRTGEAGQGQSWKNATNIQWDQDENDDNRITGGSFDVSNVLQGEDYDFTVKIDTEKRTKAINISGENVSYTETIDSGICSN